MLASISSSSQFVAIKMMKKEWQRKIAISRELRILRLAAGCPFLCHSYAAFQTQLYAYMVMEYASGGSLKQVINRKGHMETDVITFYTAEIVCGLQFLHANGIVHRDIKTDNILMTGDGHIKIADFGVAVEDMFGGRKIKGRTGTLKYMAPEVLDMKAYDVGADWWSLGIVICKMASKTDPFSDGSHGDNYTSSVIQDEPIFPEGLSSDLEDLLRKVRILRGGS
ncbi:protein kinase C delta type-like [Xenopus laevis]|uniref:Protein kinase C delta type-like n=1 Tax=Xenopus laevis TaxID=8355 RepID=A0A8J0UAZ4_XENLA|nr:protein kinase C delta type-like [Xenopus laevis]